MELETYQMTIDRYLTHHNYAVIYDNGNEKLIQLKNLKLVWIDSTDLGKYTLEEVTLGRDGSQFENVDISTVIDRIQDLEGGNDSFSKSWHVDDCHDSEDSSWADYVEDIYVGYVTHQVKPNNKGYSLVPTSDDNSIEEKLCQRKIATILAALRYFQSSRDYMSLDLPHFIDNEPLSNEEIDELCELINCGEVL